MIRDGVGIWRTAGGHAVSARTIDICPERKVEFIVRHPRHRRNAGIPGRPEEGPAEGIVHGRTVDVKGGGTARLQTCGKNNGENLSLAYRYRETR